MSDNTSYRRVSYREADGQGIADAVEYPTSQVLISPGYTAPDNATIIGINYFGNDTETFILTCVANHKERATFDLKFNPNAREKPVFCSRINFHADHVPSGIDDDNPGDPQLEVYIQYNYASTGPR